MTTVDWYVHERRIGNVAFVKCDVEGAEMLVLQGSRGIVSSVNPPMWLLELNKFTCNAVGYEPKELLDFLQQTADYRFYRLGRSRRGMLWRLVDVGECEDLENVLCAVPEVHGNRIKGIVM